MPSAAPNSVAVSTTAAAAPARSGGTAPMISSLPTVMTPTMPPA